VLAARAPATTQSFSVIWGQNEGRPRSEGDDLVRVVPWPCACSALLRQFNRKTFHAAGQRYGDASYRCHVVIMPSRIHFGPTGDDLDRSGDKQRGHNDHGEYVTHGKPLFPHRVGIVSITSKRCDRRHKGPLFCGHPSAKGQPLCLALRLKVSAVLVVKSTNGLLDFVPITCAVTLQNYSKEDTMGDRERLPIGFFRDMISLPIVTEVMLYGHVRLIEGIVLPPTFVGC
jgi:hypothetical protein